MTRRILRLSRAVCRRIRSRVSRVPRAVCRMARRIRRLSRAICRRIRSRASAAFPGPSAAWPAASSDFPGPSGAWPAASADFPGPSATSPVGPASAPAAALVSGAESAPKAALGRVAARASAVSTASTATTARTLGLRPVIPPLGVSARRNRLAPDRPPLITLFSFLAVRLQGTTMIRGCATRVNGISLLNAVTQRRGRARPRGSASRPPGHRP